MKNLFLAVALTAATAPAAFAQTQTPTRPVQDSSRMPNRPPMTNTPTTPGIPADSLRQPERTPMGQPTTPNGDQR